MDCRAELDVLLAVPSAQSACGMGIDMKRERILKFTTPASIWQEAFPIGNGRLGAFVYGGTDGELLRINEDTLWSGYPGDEQTGMTKDAIDQARELAKQGRYREADALLKESNKGARDVQIYEPFGDLVCRHVACPLGEHVGGGRRREGNPLHGRSGAEHEGDAQHFEIVRGERVERRTVCQQALSGLCDLNVGGYYEGWLCHFFAL